MIIRNCLKFLLNRYSLTRSMLWLYRAKRINNSSKLSLEEIENIIAQQYFKVHNYNMDWNNPSTYTQKLNYSKLYNPTYMKTKLTDKLQVRDWIKNKIGENYLIPILGVYNNFTDIQFDLLPNSFVIKCNHDSGSTTIINNKNDLKNIDYYRELYDFYYKRLNYAYTAFESHYYSIKPKILIEKLMTDKDDDCLKDYKFLCFDGKPYFCWVDGDRFTAHKRNIYDLDWEYAGFKQHFPEDKHIIKPPVFNDMLDIVKKLCVGFDHVRVDLYYTNCNIYFGEMTFTNGAGMEKITPFDWDMKLGELWKLNTDNRLVAQNEKLDTYKKFLEKNCLR